MLGKKGFYRHPAFIAFIIGLIIGIVLVVLMAKGVIPLSICPAPVK
jgi:hypothetical protein